MPKCLAVEFSLVEISFAGLALSVGGVTPRREIVFRKTNGQLHSDVAQVLLPQLMFVLRFFISPRLLLAYEITSLRRILKYMCSYLV